MAKPPGLVEKTMQVDGRHPPYRAVTLGDARDDWAVHDASGELIYLGDAKTAATVASRLTPVA